MILLKKKKNVLKKNFFKINIKIKSSSNILFFEGKQGIVKFKLLSQVKLNFFELIQRLSNLDKSLNTGWISVLFLNGLGFKSTRKVTNLKKKYWRFNVGHSHVFQYFVPENIIFKARNRYICIFGYEKKQVFNLSEKLKTFKSLNIYKGTGIQYPNQVYKLKVGKLKQ